jgi:hypothetical protein
MRSSRLSISIITALVGLGLLIAIVGTPTHADDTLIPLGPDQPLSRTAYRDALSHLYDGGRVHWAAAAVSDTVQPGDLLIPGGLSTAAGHTALTTTLPLSRAYALRPGDVAILRATTVVTTGENEYVAMWELAQVRQLLDGYLVGSLPYTVLDESAVAGGGLATADLLIIPAIRPDAVPTVTQALSETGALEAIRAFVERGGTLYAQSYGAAIAEAAGVLTAGVVDPSATVELTGSDPNRGQLAVQQPNSPLSWSWLTDTLYVLTDPILHPTSEMEIVATFANGANAPAVVRADVGEGQVILVAGHPTDEARRLQVPVFMDAVFLALASRAELTGDAIQTFNLAYDPHEFPAYERVPVSATLVTANLWDEKITGVVVTETVSGGYTVLSGTISPAPRDFYTVTAPVTQTVIVWDLGQLAPGEEITLTYQAESDPDALAAGVGTFSTGGMRYDDPELGPTEVRHRPFVLTAQMAARLVGDRDLEADRHYRIPAEGTYLDVALALENKEWTLAQNVVVTDWVYLLYPFVDIENQHVILSANDGETIWMRNEPFLWANSNYPLPVGAPSPTHTYTLEEDWQGDWCVFTSTHGIHIDPPPAGTRTDDYGSFITIPPTYTDYLSVTADHELLLPCMPLVFDLGDWPGYWYEEPAVRYGVHSRELFSRAVVFHGTPRPDTVVLPHDAGSLYVAAGSDPVPYRDYLEAEVPYAAAAPTPSGVTYQDVWSRTHAMPFRATFYDTWDWDTCATCGGWVERHAAINVTFGLMADLDRDGTPETPVREIPTRLPETWLTLMGKSYNLADYGIPADMNLIDLPIFHGLGIEIVPRQGTWFDSFDPATGHSDLVTVTETAAYDHLLIQQEIPPGVAEVFYVDGTIRTYGSNHEGMFKLHDGARLVYRQMLAGPNRYEVYDSHVHSANGLSSDGEVEGWAGPTAVSVYGDHVYYIYTVDDLYDARAFDEDPYMESWGYGDFVATVYAGGREGKTLLRSIVTDHDATKARVSLDNNIGVTLTDVSVTVETPAWITATLAYTDPDTAPEPIWPELDFLHVDQIPDAWRGVYYFDLAVGAIPTDLVGTVVTLPVEISADGLPEGYEAPPLVLGLGSAPEVVFGPAGDLVLTDTLPANVAVDGAALVNGTMALSLTQATDYDALHPLSDTAAVLFDTLAPTLTFTLGDGVLAVDLPPVLRTLPQEEPLRVAVRATITRAHHGPNPVGDGGIICYTDPFGVRWCEQGEPLTAEAGGAAVVVDYFCEGGDAGVVADGAGHCTVPPNRTSEITLRVTAYNEGDALAAGVTTTPTLPSGVTAVDPVGTLAFGDLDPGGWRSARITLAVRPTGEGTEPAPTGWQFPVVERTMGAFEDTASQRTITGQVGDDYAVGVLWREYLAYLPVCLRGYDPRPDLLVTQVVVDPGDPTAVAVTIRNQGQATARDFWVDLYLDPQAPPGPNQPWPDAGCLYGAAWFVDALAAGESLTLAVDDVLWMESESQWPAAYPAGHHEVWAYADSWGHPSPWGAVSEGNEANNRFGPVEFTAEGRAPSSDRLPASLFLPRPRYPGGE